MTVNDDTSKMPVLLLRLSYQMVMVPQFLISCKQVTVVVSWFIAEEH